MNYDGEESFLTLGLMTTADIIPLQIIFRKNGQFIPSVVNNTRYLRQ